MRTALLFTLLAITAQAAKIEQIDLDIERPMRPFAIQVTEDMDTTARANIKASGGDFDPEGWQGLLWFGDTAGGTTLTNTVNAYGRMEWDMKAASMPTNGRYSVQIFGASATRTEEWGRGTMIVRINPSKDYMPADWGSSAMRAVEADISYLFASNAAVVGRLNIGEPKWDMAFNWGDWRPSAAAATNYTDAAIAAILPPISVADARRVVQADSNAWVAVEGGAGWLYQVTYPYGPFDAWVEVVSGSPGSVLTGGYQYPTSLPPPPYWSIKPPGTVYRAVDPPQWRTGVIGSNSMESIYYVYGDDATPGAGRETFFTRPIAAGIFGDYSFHHGYLGSGVVRVISGTPVTNRYPIATQVDISVLVNDHNIDELAHADIRQAIADIPRVPTNATRGWLMYDAGLEKWLQVAPTNGAFIVYKED